MNWLFSMARLHMIEAKMYLEKGEVDQCGKSLVLHRQTWRAIKLLQEVLNGTIQPGNERH